MPQNTRKKIHVTVGRDNADFVGATSLCIQAAVDYVAARAGGTVEIRPGTFELENSVRLRNHVRLIGSGDKTVLRKGPSATIPLAEDMDWYEWKVTVEDAGPFKVGGGLVLQGNCPHSGRFILTKHTVVRKEGETLWLDSQPRHNFWLGREATASTLFPLVTADWVTDIEVANLAIDGNRDRSAYLNGNWGGAMFFQDCERVRIDNVQASDIESDALSFQIVHDLTVENCRFVNAINGIHPGSGSQRPIIRNNVVRNCKCGLGWCWGVKHGLAEGNVIEDCETGSSIGHRDTDNMMRNNVIRNCTEHGLYVRPDPKHQAAHRNLIEANLFEDVGAVDKPAYAIDLNGPVEGMAIKGNTIRCQDERLLKAGIRICPEVIDLALDSNTFEGVKTPIADERES